MNIYMSTDIYIYRHVYTYIHTYIHIYIYTHKFLNQNQLSYLSGFFHLGMPDGGDRVIQSMIVQD